MKIENIFNEKQEKAWETLNLMLDPKIESGGTGRSTILAYAYLNRMLQTPGITFHIEDILGSCTNDSDLVSNILDIANKLNYRLHTTMSGKYLLYNGKKDEIIFDKKFFEKPEMIDQSI